MHYRTDTTYDFADQNESRADRAEWALAVATDSNVEHDGGEGAELDVSDLLANVMHFCDRAGLDFESIVDRAERSYQGDSEDGPDTKRDTERFPA